LVECDAGASYAHPDGIEASLHLGALVLAEPVEEIGELVRSVR